jgi:hypothetical protein
VFSSTLPSIASCKKEFGVTKARAILVVILVDLANQYNTGQNMDEFQVADLADDIIEIYYWLKIDDLKLCFKFAKVGRFGVVYRIDGPTVLGWLETYSNHRLHSAEELSYTQHASTKNEIRVENVEQVYKEFEKRKFQGR